MTALAWALGLAVGAFWVYSLLCLWSAWSWRKAARARYAGPAPAVSILKPLCGVDAEQLENLTSFARLDYPEYEIVFGSLDAADPALDDARRVAAAHPDVRIRVVAGADEFGLNRKVCTLDRLAAEARYPVFVLCDSDMRVAPDYLSRVVAPFAEPEVGLVTCLYRAACVRGLAARLEAIAIGCDFIPSVLLTRRLSGLGFALGATIAIRRETLERIGGFRPLANELADDYRLGERVRRLGLKVALADTVVDDVIGAVDFGSMWVRRVRWAKTCRAMQPAGWAGSIVTHGLVMAAAFAAVRGLDAVGASVLAATAALRVAVAGAIAGGVTQDREALRSLWLSPLSDVLSFAVWVASFIGRSVVWRGRRFRLGRDGALERLPGDADP
jgi:ceramide glucosyltransferase